MKDYPSHKPTTAGGAGSSMPITEADLHAYVDQLLPPERIASVRQFLATNPEARERVNAWQQQNHLLHKLLDPVMNEPVPSDFPLQPPAKHFPWSALAASVLIATLSAGAAWSLRGYVDSQTVNIVVANAPQWDHETTTPNTTLASFARRAAVAHAVYSPDARRPVEMGADQEQALVTWLTKRIGTPIRPPQLNRLGYALIGGRLLPGEQGPVAQFMYETQDRQRLTLYVTREVPKDMNTSFQFGKDGPVNVFYWVENHLGYAISSDSGRSELMRVSQEIYTQLKTDN